MEPSERKEREKEKRRIEIICAGEKLFLQKGLNGTTMDEIARECESAKGTLYLYFKSKEQLFLEIVLSAMKDLYSGMEKAVSSGKDPIDKLARSGKAYYGFFRKNTGYFRILSRLIDIEHDFIAEFGDLAAELIMINNKLWDLLTAAVKEGMRDGVFKEDTNPLEIAISLYASSTTILRMIDHVAEDTAKIKGMKADNPMRITFEKHGLCGMIDLEQIYSNLGRRIIESIMVHPSDLRISAAKMRKQKGAKK